MRPNRLMVAGAGVVLVGATLATAQPANDDVLRGPRVQDRRAPGAGQTFGDMDRRRAGEQAQQLRAFMGAIRSLTGDDVREDLRLTPEQGRQIREIMAGLRTGPGPDAAPGMGRGAGQGPGAGAGQNAPRGPRADRGPGAPQPPADRPAPRGNRRIGQGPPTDMPSDRPTDRAPRRADRPNDRAPGVTDVPPRRRAAPTDRPADMAARLDAASGARAQVWSILTDAQKARVREMLAQQRGQTPGAPMADAPRGRRAQAGAVPPGARNARPAPFADEMPPSLRERLEAMSPERRRALWQRLDRALADRATDAAPARRPRPPVNDVRVPPPASDR